MNTKPVWILRGLLLALPHIALWSLGGLWIWQHGWTVPFLAAAAVLMVVGWGSQWLLGKRNPPPLRTGVEPPELWSPLEQKAWAKVREISTSPELAVMPLDQPDEIWKLSLKVFDTVAREFHPRSKDPVLEVPIPSVLRVAELVTQDLRRALAQRVPGSHWLTINDLRRLHSVSQWIPTLNRLYRLGSFVVNPAAGIAREISTYAQGQLTNASLAELKLWTVRFVVEQAGKYAIDLYAGRLVVDDIPPSAFQSADSTRQQSLEVRRDEVLKEEPLRVLICGQVKAGKSSLVNALFGDVRAAVDVVPTTRGVDPYMLTRDGIDRALILDTGGYEDATQAKTALVAVREQLNTCDLILLVVSALSAARDADRRLLDELREYYRGHPERSPATVLVVLSHIDGLRPFREWSPPYDVAHPRTPKAQSIRDAIEAVAQDLGLKSDEIVPVCLEKGRVYNVEEGLIPAILERLGDSNKARYLRALKNFKDEQSWRLLGQQARSAGRLAVDLGKLAVDRARLAADSWLFPPARNSGK